LECYARHGASLTEALQRRGPKSHARPWTSRDPL
jgi:hypothetical protein